MAETIRILSPQHRCVITLLSTDPERLEELSLRGELLHYVQTEIGNPDVPRWADTQVVWIAEQTLAPAADEFPVGGIDLDRIGTLSEEPDLILAANYQAGDPACPADIVGSLGPAGIGVVFDNRRLLGKTRILRVYVGPGEDYCQGQHE